MSRVGIHIIAEFYGVRRELTITKDKIKEIINYVIKNSNLTKVGEKYKQFNPHGVTAVILLAESHLAIHTWPEYNLVNLDIFTCGAPEKAEKAFELFLEKFNPKDFRRQVIDRG